MRPPAQSAAGAWAAFLSSSVLWACALQFGVAGTHPTALACIGFLWWQQLWVGP